MEKKAWWLSLLAAVLLISACCALAQSQAEMRVLNTIKRDLESGQPLRVTELYNHFTQPEERRALAKLYNAFFRIPLFVAQYQERFGKPPSLQVISQQFGLHSPEAADVLLAVMESDPRVPRFITRNPATHQIARVNVPMILRDPRFGHALARQLGGWEGETAPPFKLARLGGGEVDSSQLKGKVYLIYVWFTGCPPCMKETPQLVTLARKFSGRGFTVVGANADGVLKLGYDDNVRRQYAREMQIDFPLVTWTPESNAAYGNIAIFPTLFLVNRNGVILHHWVGFTGLAELQHAIAGAVEGASPAR